MCVPGQLGWQDVCAGAVAQCSLWDLAKAIILLYSDAEAKDWTADTVLGIMDELAGEPIAHMLLYIPVQYSLHTFPANAAFKPPQV